MSISRHTPPATTPNILDEGPISLSAAARDPAVAIDGRALNPSTLWRWCKQGRLEYARIGRRVVTSRAALRRAVARFSEVRSAPTPALTPANVPRYAARREKEIQSAEQRLTAAGI